MCKWQVHLLSAAFLILLAATACSRKDESDADNRRVLIVSIEPQRQVLEQIVGDRFRIFTLMPKSNNPETYEPSAKERMTLNRGEIYFTTGFFPFENAVGLTIDSTTRIVNTSQGINFVYGTHSHADGHSAFLHTDSDNMAPDPHVWVSLRNARRMALNMTNAVTALDPDNADEYTGRYGQLVRRLDSLDKVFARRLADIRPRTFLVWHPTLSYFARDYNLEQIAVSSETKESTINSLRNIISEARQDSVRVFFYQKEFDSRQAEAINSGVGSRLVPISVSGYDWMEQLENIVNELAH